MVEGLTSSPIKALFGIFCLAMSLSTYGRGFFTEAGERGNNYGQWKNALQWGLDNCNNPLNISDINDIENFVDGCYHFTGDLKITGNLTIPPLVETTKCESVVGYSYVQTYGTYLARQCNFNGQNEECKNYNPACSVDTSEGFGYEVRNGWLPNNDAFVERWNSLIYEYEFEDWLEQSEEWKTAAVKGELATYAMNHEYCGKLGAGETSMCKDDFNLPGYSHMNQSRTHGYFEFFMAFEGYEESVMFINDAENMPIYAVGADSGPAIHFNVIAYEEIMSKNTKDQRDGLIAYDIETNGAQTRKWGHLNPTMYPPGPEATQETNIRHEELVTLNRRFEWYGNYLYFLIIDIMAIDKQQVEEEASRFYNPYGFEHGKVIDAPMALGDSFYSDADLEEKRLNGTVPRGSPNFLYTDDPISFHPFAYSPTVADKFRANGGEMTNAELQALPEYGDIDHFPLVTNESYWMGGDNCWEENGHGSDQKYPYGTVKVTPACRVAAPTSSIDFLGMVSKSVNKNTGQPMLIWNPIIFSDEDNVLSKLDSSHINQIPSNIQGFHERQANSWFDCLVYQWLTDALADSGAFYGLPWYHNSLGRTTAPVFYYLTWFYFMDPQLYFMQKHNPDYTTWDKLTDNHVAYMNGWHSVWWGSYVGFVGTFYLVVAIILLKADNNKEGRSSASN